MKISSGTIGLILFAAVVHGQTANPVQGSTSAVPQYTAYTIAQRDADSCIWERTNYETGPSGELIPHVHRYTEMATGMHYKDLQTGEWVDSQEQIDNLPNGGAQAVHGQHQAYFPGDIYNGQIRMVTSDGTVLNSRPLGLSYDDGTNTVLIAVLTNSVGYILGSNQVIYPNAFVGLNADLRYTYTKSGFEQDIIIREQPPTPAALDLNTKATKIQLLTEFFNPPQPTITTATVPSSAGNLTDSALGFGGMNMERGKAFLLGTNSPSARVSKQWVQINGRQFLVEEVPLPAITNGLQSLPAAVASTTVHLPIKTTAKNWNLPPQHFAQSLPAAKPMQLAKAISPEQGLVLDYNIVINNTNNITFQGDTTYYVSANTSINGTITFEGGTVIKYASGVKLTTSGWIVCKTGPYRPASFTSKDDNSIGETISGSSGFPQMNFFSGGVYLNLTSDDLYVLKYLRFSYADCGLSTDFASVWHSQFVQCFNAIRMNYDISLYNVLFGPCQGSITPTTITPVNNGTITAQNITDDGSGSINNFTPSDCTSTLNLTNCIIAGDINGGNGGTVNGSHCFSTWSQYFTGFQNLGSYPYNSYGAAGGGSYYLIDNHPARGGGTTQIDPTLLADLKTKTTHPPVVYSSASITSDTFTSQVPRDSETPGPDVGYHYDPLDYIFHSCQVNHNMTFPAGTVVGWQGQGLSFSSSSTINFNGTVLNPCAFVRCNTAQELDSSGDGTGITHSSGAGSVNASFTHFSAAGILAAFVDASGPALSAQSCEFWDGLLGGTVTGNSSFSLINDLLDRTKINFPSGSSTASLTIQNCTFHGGNLTMSYNASWSISVHNSAFDGGTLSVGSSYTPGDHNAYGPGTGTLPHAFQSGNGDVNPFSGFNWQIGPLGSYYLPNDPPTHDGTLLINAGNQSGQAAQLFHYTTQTNQTIEANSLVDIGYHYVSLGSDGNPPTTGVQGVPDYQIDSVLPQVSITAPANNSSFSTTRVNMTGTFNDAYLKEITVNGITAFTSGNAFEAMNVPLAAGANTVTATIEDLVGKTSSASITVNGSATPVDPVQLTATPVAGFAPLSVNLQITANAPGTLQQVIYDFEGDGSIGATANDLSPITHVYAAGEHFPAVTLVTSAGRFSSSGGWNSIDPNRLTINVQATPTVLNTISVTDPVDVKCDSAGNLYVLSRSTATILEYDSSGAPLRSLPSIGTTPTGLDVDVGGNVYVAVSGDNQVLKFNPTTSSFQLDTTFGTSGHIGKVDKTFGSGNGEFNSPYDVTVTPDGTAIYISDTSNNRIQKFDSTGSFISSIGSQGTAFGQFENPKGINFGADNILVVVDSGNNRLCTLLNDEVSEEFGVTGASSGQYQAPLNVSSDSRKIYVADTGNNRVQKLDRETFEQILQTPPELGLSQPSSVALADDPVTEKIWIADTGNDRALEIAVPNIDPLPTWASAKQNLINGNIELALTQFSRETVDSFRVLINSIGSSKLIQNMSAIGDLTPLEMDERKARYYFSGNVQGQQFMFIVTFSKENGQWKIKTF